MKKMPISAVAAVIAIFSGMEAAAQTPEQYGSLPDVTDVEISPNGQSLAIIKIVGAASAVLFYDLNDMGKEPVGVGLGESKPRSIVWADNDHLLLKTAQAERKRTTDGIQSIEFTRWLSIDKNEAKAEVLFGNAAGYYQGEAGVLLATTPSKPGSAIFQRSDIGSRANRGPSRLGRGSEWELELFEVDLGAGREKKIGNGNSETVDWVVDAAGSPIARVDYDWSAAERKVYVFNGREWDLKASLPEARNAGAVASFYGTGSTPGTLLATTYGSRDKRSLVEFDIDSGQFNRTVFSNERFDISEIAYNPAKASVEGVIFTDHLPRVQYINQSLESVQSSLAKALPGAAPMIVSRSADDQRMIVKALYSDHPPQFFIFDRKAKKLDMIAATYPALDGEVHARKTAFDYTSSDGLTISGYVTAPKGATMENMPLIVLPHGGPAARDDQAFDWWAFFYAANGYLVYQPNFRGSDGYGYNFRASGENQWGLKMQDDITEGVEKLIADGIADKDRICIVGASYGGYAALAGATITPDLYKCAVSVAGISNLATLLADAGKDSIWERRIGNRFGDKKYIDSVSPQKNADKVKAPILLLHGDQDVVVPMGQSRMMRKALEKANKNVEFVTLKDEDHWLSRSKTRTQLLAETIRFIDAHIGG